jgi:hypothetical protein
VAPPVLHWCVFEEAVTCSGLSTLDLVGKDICQLALLETLETFTDVSSFELHCT